MELQNIENTLKKMGMVLEKVVTKVDELDKRVAKLEGKLGEGEKKFSSQDLKAQATPQTQQSSTSGISSGGFGSSFLGSLAGAMAGMGLYNLLFNHSVTPMEFGKEMGLSEDEIQHVLDEELDEIESKLDEIDSKLEELDSKIDEVGDNDVMNTDYFESYEEEDTVDDDFGGGFDDFGGFDEV
ncbi:MAG: hypothetical protein ABGX25_06450 [Nautiliaceae bacterium]|jgi:peptidoglycan hydrolase CwlO-like protein